MTENTAIQQEQYPESRQAYAHLFDQAEPSMGWHVLWTRSNCERLVHDQLAAKGYEVFLPMMEQWSTRKDGSRSACRVPMFKGYLFLRHAVSKEDYIDISNARGLVCMLGARWDRLAYVPDNEVETIRLAVQSELPAMPYPYLKEGDKVRITQGSLTNAEGVLVETEPSKGLFVISVNLLRRSVAVEVDCSNVEPL